jgi:hypothetical protein
MKSLIKNENSKKEETNVDRKSIDHKLKAGYLSFTPEKGDLF